MSSWAFTIGDIYGQGYSTVEMGIRNAYIPPYEISFKTQMNIFL